MAIDIDVARRLGDRTIAARFAAGSGLTALFGPSGAGKTSILNMVAGLLRPDRGHIRIGERTLFDGATDLPPEARRVGYVFQDGRLFPHRRVRANLTYGHDLAPPANRWMSLEEATQFLGIGHLLDRWPHSLSGGEAQRVAIGRALLAGPEILLMDEPLSSLDAARRGDIMAVIERIRDELELPILYVSHDRAEVDRLATQVVAIGE
ncbi:MAG: ATP-binding cassette domain-containing protein [Sphingopyxis sp.]|uniref:molybdenum ABC transporter ATP-binding protein n=1 Tax=Sphingopyxis sp. TaxID=1908224 RepID=UPI001A20B7F7|nr:ATP-binding cassette domain-containing protein [Sphingopyxis sp.]MBJ7500659.1 ATP-binding cassette domain-containing protein [Sphingopyxis sp.]